MPTLTLHHLEKSRSTRVLWALHELGLDYEIVQYKRGPDLRAEPALKRVHPLGKSPVVTIDDQVYAESGAILEMLVERYGEGRLRPEKTEERDQYRFWMHFAEGTLMTPLLLSLVMGRIRDAPVPFFVRPIARRIVDKVNDSFTHPEMRNNLAFVEQTLAGQPWLAGEHFSAADIQMSYPLQAAMTRVPEPNATPHIQAFIKRFEERPAYRKAVEVGGDPMLTPR